MTHPILISDQWFLRPGKSGDAQSSPALKRRGVMGLHCHVPAIDGGFAEIDLARLTSGALRPVVVHVTGDVSRPELTAAWLKKIAASLAGRVSMVELSLAGSGAYDKPSAARADVRAGDILRASIDDFEAAGLMLALRHAHGHWLARIEDSVRVLMRVNHPQVGVSLSLPDWAKSDGTRLDDRLHLALPRLMNVIIDDQTAGDEYPGARGLLDRLATLGYIGPVTICPGEKNAGLDEAMRGI